MNEGPTITQLPEGLLNKCCDCVIKTYTIVNKANESPNNQVIFGQLNVKVKHKIRSQAFLKVDDDA